MASVEYKALNKLGHRKWKSRSIPLEDRDGNVLPPPQVDPAESAAQEKGKYDSNYSIDSAGEGDSQSELMKLKLKS